MKKQVVTLAEFPAPNTEVLEWQILADCVTEPRFIPAAVKAFAGRPFKGTCMKYWNELNRMFQEGASIDLVTFTQRVGRQVNKELVTYMLNSTFDGEGFRGHLAALQNEQFRAMFYEMNVQNLLAMEDPNNDINTLLTLTNANLENIQNTAPTAATTKTLTDYMKEYTEQLERQLCEGQNPKTTTGFRSIDAATGGGYEGGELVIIAARPGTGKTTTILQMAEAAARAGKKAGIYSLEMKGQKLIARMQYANGLTPSDEKAGNWKRIQEIQDDLSNLDIFIRDDIRQYGMIQSDIRAKHAAGKLDIAFIDYLGLIENRNEWNKTATNAERLDELMRGLKATAQNLTIPVIVAAQLNRSIENDEREHPRLSDLNGSTGIEANADSVIILKRDRSEPIADPMQPPKTVSMYLVKNRNGIANLQTTLYPNETHSKFQEGDTHTI